MSSTLLDELNSKRSELKAERERLRQRVKEVDEQLDALNKTLQMFSSEEDEKEDDKYLSEWPSAQSMPSKVTHVLESVGKIMKPREVDKYVRANSTEKVRDNAVAETLSRLARRDELARKDYGESSYYYGLRQWYSDDEDDFAESLKPEQLSSDRNLLSYDQ